MTDLPVRRVGFDFGGSIPFQWHPGNPEFGLMANAACVLISAFEKYIVSVVHRALPSIADPQIAAEAAGFLRQEAQHARAHRLHLEALIRAHPGLQQTVDEAAAAYRSLLSARPLAFHLAYVADLEATFLPVFTLLLEHEDTLLRPGDERVASLFLYHIAEEVEHRSSAVIIYRHLIGDEWYRLRALPFVARHVLRVYTDAVRSFDRHVPLAQRRIDATRVVPGRALSRELRARLPLVGGRVPGVSAEGTAFGTVRLGALLKALGGLARCQLPGHDPARRPVPGFAQEWFARYEAGADVTRWYSSAAGAAVPAAGPPRPGPQPTPCPTLPDPARPGKVSR